MQLATPISHLFRIADVAARLDRASDVLEGRDHTKDIFLARQRLFHFEASLVLPWEDNQKAFIQQILAERPNLEVASFHLAASCSKPVFDGVMFQPGGVFYGRSELLLFALDNVRWLKHVLQGRSVKLAVENNNYYPTKAYEYVTDADFITQLVRESGLSFLFDLAHAHITAQNSGVPYAEYLAGLPMEQAVQIHLCRWAANKDGLAWDAHEVPGESELAEVRGLLSAFSIEYMTVEYYKDTDRLLAVLDLFRAQLGGGR